MNNLAPIVLFTYNRLDHTKQTVEALKKNDLAIASDLIIYSDGPKKNHENNVESVRNYLKEVKGFKSINIYESQINKGLANSIIDGVSDIINKYGKVIVLEDDLVTSPSFLNYMNNALDLYENDEKVISIHGYVYPIRKKLPETFFIKGADCWGWATWKRGWVEFCSDGKFLLNQLESKKLTKAFDFNNSYPYTQMLKKQIDGLNDSWAIRWYASAILKEKLTLYPGKSYIKNIGLDNTGTHCSIVENDLFNSLEFNYNVTTKPIKIKENKMVRKLFIKYFNGLDERKTSIRKKIKKIIKLLLPYGLVIILKKLKRTKIVNSIESEKSSPNDFYEGPFEYWSTAVSITKGYNDESILNKCSLALRKVRDGNAIYERDSFLFEKKEYSFPLLTTLLLANNCNKELNILDFGGSLGSSYFQNREFLFGKIKWNIVEQEEFVTEGNKHFKSNELFFYNSIKEYISINFPSVIVLSSVLPYLEDPYYWLKEIIDIGSEFIIVDRTVINYSNDDLIFIQNVPKEIYSASYPLWFLSEKKMKSFFYNNYEILFDINSFTNSVINMKDFEEKCFVFKRKR